MIKAIDLDSVASNATAHYLHNMFYVLGDSVEKSAKPVKWLPSYRANPIENFDTAAIRAKTEEGVEILFLTTHAVNIHPIPQFCYEFENARVVFGDPISLRAIIMFWPYLMMAGPRATEIPTRWMGSGRCGWL